jgi:hypothetical protein
MEGIRKAPTTQVLTAIGVGGRYANLPVSCPSAAAAWSQPAVAVSQSGWAAVPATAPWPAPPAHAQGACNAPTRPALGQQRLVAKTTGAMRATEDPLGFAVQPHIVERNVELAELLFSRDLGEAWRTWSRMRDRGVVILNELTVALEGALNGDAQAIGRFAALTHRQDTEQTSSVQAHFDALVGRGQVDLAVALCRRSPEINPRGYLALLGALSRDKRHGTVRNIYELAHSRGVALTSQARLYALRAYGALKDLHGARWVIASMPAQEQAQTICYNIVIKILLAHGKLSCALQEYQAMNDAGVQPDAWTYATFIHTLVLGHEGRDPMLRYTAQGAAPLLAHLRREMTARGVVPFQRTLWILQHYDRAQALRQPCPPSPFRPWVARGTTLREAVS